MHFTYCNDSNGESLLQGDILRNSGDLQIALQKYHPHYEPSRYPYLLVLTQSCDLVKRHDSNCKARYITLAAIRPLADAVSREIEKLQIKTIERRADALSTRCKTEMKRFLERLFNNNEPAYFYLHPCASTCVTEPMVAFLRLSVAIRAKEHYDACLKEKKTSITSEFQAKLGWLVGQLYSRVGTRDWGEEDNLGAELKKLIEEQLESATFWVDEFRIDKGGKKAKKPEFDDATSDELRDMLKCIETPDYGQTLVDRIESIVCELVKNADFPDEETRDKIINHFRDKIPLRIQNDKVAASVLSRLNK